MCADQSIHKLGENGQKTIVFVFCGEQFTNTLRAETMQELINRAIMFPENINKYFNAINCNKEAESEKNGIPAMISRITEILCYLGVPANLLGYKYLRSAIYIALTDRESLYGVTKILYPAVAKEFNTSSSSVERAIRHAIEAACNRGDMEAFRKVFGNAVSPNTGKPTNSEFISKIAERLRMDDSFSAAIPNYV